MIEAYWLEQTEADLPAENDWLSADETLRLEQMRFAKRRADWRLGRWTAKRALAVYLDLPAHPQSLSRIEIRAASSGAPEVFFAGQPAPVTVSLSHRAGLAVCAIATSGVALGCDLELIEPRSDVFAADYFTPGEQELLAWAFPPNRSLLLALLWSAKESALKALGVGLRADTRSVIVDPFDVPSELGENREEGMGATVIPQPSRLDNWRPLHVYCTSSQVFQGWWRQADNFVRTLIAAPATALPTPLRFPPSAESNMRCR